MIPQTYSSDLDGCSDDLKPEKEVNMRRNCQVEAIYSMATENDKDNPMFEAVLGIKNKGEQQFHGSAVTVLGDDLTECVERCYIILQAFNGER